MGTGLSAGSHAGRDCAITHELSPPFGASLSLCPFPAPSSSSQITSFVQIDFQWARNLIFSKRNCINLRFLGRLLLKPHLLQLRILWLRFWRSCKLWLKNLPLLRHFIMLFFWHGFLPVGRELTLRHLPREEIQLFLAVGKAEEQWAHRGGGGLATGAAEQPRAPDLLRLQRLIAKCVCCRSVRQVGEEAGLAAPGSCFKVILEVDRFFLFCIQPYSFTDLTGT